MAAQTSRGMDSSSGWGVDTRARRFSSVPPASCASCANHQTWISGLYSCSPSPFASVAQPYTAPPLKSQALFAWDTFIVTSSSIFKNVIRYHNTTFLRLFPTFSIPSISLCPPCFRPSFRPDFEFFASHSLIFCETLFFRPTVCYNVVSESILPVSRSAAPGPVWPRRTTAVRLSPDGHLLRRKCNRNERYYPRGW